jgi:hypothetical protein
MTLYSCLLPLSEKNNLILYSIFDHLTFGGWGIFLFAIKKPKIPELWTFVWSFCTLQNVVTVQRRVWRYQRGNQNPYIEEEETTQWPKEKILYSIFDHLTFGGWGIFLFVKKKKPRI